MGKSTISMAIFHSYINLPEGKPLDLGGAEPQFRRVPRLRDSSQVSKEHCITKLEKIQYQALNKNNNNNNNSNNDDNNNDNIHLT